MQERQEVNTMAIEVKKREKESHFQYDTYIRGNMIILNLFYFEKKFI